MVDQNRTADKRKVDLGRIHADRFVMYAEAADSPDCPVQTRALALRELHQMTLESIVAAAAERQN